MSKNKIFDKLKDGVSVRELEGFAGKHVTEVFSILALIIAAISSSFDFFTGPKLTLLFLTVGVITAILFPAPIERGLKHLYGFTLKQEKMTEIIIGAVTIVIAVFIPFLYFSLIGLLAGASFRYYIRHAHIISENRFKEPHSYAAGEDLD